MTTKLDPKLLQAIRVDLNAAFADIVKKHGLQSLVAGAAGFDPTVGNFSFKVEGMVEGGITRQAALYMDVRKRFFTDLPELNSTITTDDGTAYKIVGSNTTGTKIIGQRADGKCFNIPTETVRDLTNKAAAAKPARKHK